MTPAPQTQRDLFESAVIERMKESGFLEVEIRVECLARYDDGYCDPVINAGWHYWNAAVAAAPRTPSVAVKALEWNPYRAETPFGYYDINDQRDVPESELKGREPFLLTGSRLDYSRHPTLDAARAAAQADYEARIRSALSAQVQDKAETEAIAALKEAEPYVELCHSLMTQKEPRANVWRVLKRVRAAIAGAPAKQEC